MSFRKWRSLTSIFTGRKARSKEAELRLTLAYQRVFKGKPESADQELVLADMANAASWRRFCPASVSNDELRHIEGSRALFARVFAFLSLSEGDVEALEKAVRHEAIADEQPYFGE